MKQIQELQQEIKAAQRIIDECLENSNNPINDSRHPMHKPASDALNRLQSQLVESTAKLDFMLKKSGLKY